MNVTSRSWMMTRLLSAAIALLLCAYSPARAAEMDAGQPVRIGYLLGLRAKSLQTEYKLAVKLLMDRVFKDLHLPVKLIGFETPEDALSAFSREEIDVTEMGGLELLLMDPAERQRLSIVTVSQLGDASLVEYLLLVPPGKTLEQLKGGVVKLVGSSDWNQGLNGWMQFCFKISAQAWNIISGESILSMCRILQM
ncbi:MAG: hypothetical protein R3F19_15280 [Verrucomicrobiales bacterium]